MTEEEYILAVECILKKLGGSYSAPSGFSENELYFSFPTKPITIPYPDKLTSNERQVTITRLLKKYADVKL